MRIKYFLILIFTLFLVASNNFAYAENIQISELQRSRSSAKIYVPNFVVRGSEAKFKVFTKPNYHVKLVIDYASYIDKKILESDANENGVAVFTVKILDDEELVGKSVAIDAFVCTKEGDDFQKAVMQTELGEPSASNRIEIADKDTEKGFYFSPMQAINQVRMNYDYDDDSGYNPVSQQMYYDSTPVYVRNMRDAQENVRAIPTNNSNSNR